MKLYRSRRRQMNPEIEIRRRTRRSFLVGGLAAAAGYAGYRWVGREGEGELPSALRRNLENNERIVGAYFRNSHVAKEYPSEEARVPKVNGDIGMDEGFDPAQWKLQFRNREITLDEI